MPIVLKKILVCGGAGFIGSNFVRHVYHTHPTYQIFNLDLLTYSGNRKNLADIEKNEENISEEERRYKFIHGDICDKELLNNLFINYHFDAVVNFAAESHVDRSLCSADDFIRTNFTGVHALIEQCRKFKTPRFLQISTDEVYGDVVGGFSTEESSLRPSNPYSASKAAADLLIKSYVRSHNLEAVIIRGSNNFGPYQYPEKLIPLAITNYLENKKIPVHGTGQHVRSWVHVLDFCQAIDTVLHRGQDGHIYNVGGVLKTNLEVLEAIKSALSLPGELKEYVVHTNDRPGADKRYAQDDLKICKELGWSPLYKFDEVIGSTVKWYLDQKDWWQEIKGKQIFIEHYNRQEQANYY